MRGVKPAVERLLIARQGELLAVEEVVAADHGRNPGLYPVRSAQFPPADQDIQDLRHRASECLSSANRKLPDGSHVQHVRPVLAAQFMLRAGAGDLRTPEGRVLEQPGQGVGGDQAESLLETMVDLDRQCVILVLAPGVAGAAQSAEEREWPQQIGDRAVLIG